ncbi:MAG: mucoidy inhibitor MuiA family protein [Syntrophales bacterium LBB04]|nr:mucoidy inhibitor MuiA family protein [Syntrophales bacterium LBB04]
MTDRKISAKKCISAGVIFLLFHPATSWSLPREVTFFPGSAQVLEVAKVKLLPEGIDQAKTLIILPGQADPDSLVVRIANNAKIRIDDINWRQVSRQNDEKIANLMKQLEKLKETRKNLQATIRSLDTQIQFWQQQTKAKLKTMADVHNMSAAIGKSIQKAYQDKLSKESELEKIDRLMKEAQDDLDRAAGRKETAWEVTVILSGLRSAEAILTYTYTLAGCGWHPLYRLEAKPKDKQIIFTWEAEIWQSSGQDWNNVTINLATLKPPSSISPAELTPWIIKPRPQYRREVGMQRALKSAAAADKMEAPAPAEEGAIGAKQVRETTYSVWQIGKKNVPAGAKQKVKIEEELWPAEFTYMARPSRDSQVFLRAKVKLPEGKDIPTGSSLYIVDGAILGKRSFALAGQEATIFFGIDPLVTAQTQLISKKSGEKTFLQDKQTFTWDWRTDIQNFRDSPVKVIIEEPNPQPRDERIAVTLKCDPEPAGKAPSSLTWDMDISAGQKKSLFMTVRIEAPKSMDHDLGWRQ